MSIMRPRLTSVVAVAIERVPNRAPWTAMAKCATCGAVLEDVSQRYCGGDRCDRVWMRHSTLEFYTDEDSLHTMNAIDDLRGQGRITSLKAEGEPVAAPDEIGTALSTDGELLQGDVLVPEPNPYREDGGEG